MQDLSVNEGSSSLSRLEYFGYKYGKATVAVPAHNTSQICSNCGAVVKTSLSTRTHICECGYSEDRDVNAAINILQKGLSTVGHTGTYAWGVLPRDDVEIEGVFIDRSCSKQTNKL